MKKVAFVAIVIVIVGGVFWYLNVASTVIAPRESSQGGIVKPEAKGNETNNSGSSLVPPAFPN
jgi:hypothetical protein